MNVDRDNETLIRRYALGELSDAEQSRVEERLFADSDFFHDVEAARDELIDDYLQGELSNHERERFERYFLASPSRRERVESARALLRVVASVTVIERPDASTSRNKPAFPWQAFPAFLGAQTSSATLVAGAVILCVILAEVWLVVDTLRARNQLEQLRTERETIQQREQELERQLAEQQQGTDELGAQLRQAQNERERLAAELAALKANGNGARPEPPLIASLTLSPILVRDADKAPRLVIGPDVKTVRLQALFDGDSYKSYRVALQTVEGQMVSQRKGLEASGKTVVMRFRADEFKEADYLITLSGVSAKREVEVVGKYYFRVLKR